MCERRESVSERRECERRELDRMSERECVCERRERVFVRGESVREGGEVSE